jgi:hypothetical protein
MKKYNKKDKYLIIAHNGHIQKEGYDNFDNKKNNFDNKKNNFDNKKWFGNYLYKKFKNQYLAIGNTFYNGNYLAKNVDKKYKLTKIKVNREKFFERGIYFINENSGNNFIYESGSLGSSKNPYIHFTKEKLNKRFDILIVINNEKSFIPII